MKNIIIILILLSITENLFSQKDDIKLVTDKHKYVTYQAWQLIKHYHPEVAFTIMHMAMKNPINGNYGDYWSSDYDGNTPWERGTILTGSYREDLEDPVYCYCGIENSELTKVHFWDADCGDVDRGLSGLQGTNEKMNAYWTSNIPGWDGIGLSIGPIRQNNNLDYSVSLRYNNLAQVYADPWYCIVDFYRPYTRCGSTGWIPITGSIPFVQYLTFWCGKTEEQAFIIIRKIVWEIVGRMCHLIQDMGIPAHVHNDAHPVSDYYEDIYLNDQGHFDDKTYLDAILQGSYYNEDPIINLNNLQNPIRTITYLANQLSDRFPSDNGNADISFTENLNNDDATFIFNQLHSKYELLSGISCEAFQNDPPEGLMETILDQNYVYSIRSTAGFLWYVYNQFGITPQATELEITKFTSNMIGDQQNGFTLFKGQTGALYPTVQGSPVNYQWYYKICSNSDWWSWPLNSYGINTMSSNSGPNFVVKNNNFAGQTCPNGENAPSALYLIAKLRVYNNYAEDLSPLIKIKPQIHTGGGGCPYIFVLGNDSTGGKYFTENNILHHSEFTENINQSITDVYKLKTVPKIDSNKITIQIMETENDVNYFDQIKLFAVDHPVGSKIGISESNDIVMYYPEDVSSTDFATQNFSSNNIAPYIQYGQPLPKITGINNDFVNSHYDSTSQNLKLNSYINRLKAKGFRNISDSLALIGEIGSDALIQPIIAKDWAGSVSIYTNSDTYVKPFSKRVNVSEVIIPFSQTSDIVDHIDINFNSDYAMSYISVVPVSYEGFIKTELSLIDAVHAVNGNILSSLSNIDNDFAVMDTTAIIDLKFGSINPPEPSMVRDYVFVVYGKYTSENRLLNGQPLQTSSNNNLKPDNIAYKYKLNANYPNPFNPTTKISYSLAKPGNTKLVIYDVLGRLMNVIVNEYKSAGEYIVEFNGSHLSSGVYIYRLESNDFVDTKRMVLIK